MCLFTCFHENMSIHIICIKQEEARNAEDHCESIFASIIDSLQRHFLLVKELIVDQEKVAAAQVQTTLQTLQMKMEEMRKRSAELERLAQTDNDVHFLQVLGSRYQTLPRSI